MPDFGRNRGNDDPSLDAVVRSDRFIDALAAGAPVEPLDDADAVLAGMLGEWRDELRWPPATGLVSENQAVAALRSGLTDKQTTRRSRRGLSVVGSVAAAALFIGGFGAVVAGAGPGDALYGLRTMLFGAPKQVRDDQVALAAQTELNKVQDLIAQGDWQQAQDKLVAVSSQVETLGDEQQKQELLDQWNQLSAKVVQKDPEATVPPGITYTVPPSATELVPAAVTPTSGPEVPPTSTPGSPAATTSTSVAPTSQESATTSTTPSAPTSSTPTSSAQPSPTSTTASPTSTTASTPRSSTTAPSSTTVPTTTATPAGTTPTSAAPATSAAPTTTAAPVATSTAAPAPAATTTAPAAAPPSTAVVQQSVASEPASAPPTAAQTTKSAPQIVITTTVPPAPAPQTGSGQSAGN